MAATYQFGANPQIDYPRLLTADTDMTNPIFDDREILAMYNIDAPAVFVANQYSSGTTPKTFGTPSYRRVAAGLLDCLANDKARLGGALKVLDIDVDLSKAATSLKAAANNLRTVDDEGAGFAWVEMVQDSFSYRERITKSWFRELQL